MYKCDKVTCFLQMLSLFRFQLGTEDRANLYILQYQELFAEDGRRPASVTVVSIKVVVDCLFHPVAGKTVAVETGATFSGFGFEAVNTVMAVRFY